MAELCKEGKDLHCKTTESLICTRHREIAKKRLCYVLLFESINTFFLDEHSKVLL